MESNAGRADAEHSDAGRAALGRVRQRPPLVSEGEPGAFPVKLANQFLGGGVVGGLPRLGVLVDLVPLNLVDGHGRFAGPVEFQLPPGWLDGLLLAADVDGVPLVVQLLPPEGEPAHLPPQVVQRLALELEGRQAVEVEPERGERVGQAAAQVHGQPVMGGTIAWQSGCHLSYLQDTPPIPDATRPPSSRPGKRPRRLPRLCRKPPFPAQKRGSGRRRA